MSKVSKNVKVSAKPKNAVAPDDAADSLMMKRALAAIGILCLISTIVFDKSKEMGGAVFPIMCVLGAAVCAGYLYYEKKLTTENAVLLIIAAGFLLRLNYVIYTPLSETTRIRQHDLFAFGGQKGHSAYIEHFYNNGFTLPDFDPTAKSQFYHPPLHHLLAAMWMRILTTFGMSYTRAIGSLQFLTLFYSSCCMLVCERIFTRLRLKGGFKLLALSIIAFHPIFFMLAGSVNNDVLALLLTLLSVYTALRWYEQPTTKNILMIALSIGLGMSTKLSAALVAIPIALLFLMKLISDKKHVYENILQFCKFGLVCIPLGLWFPIRNAIRFDVPLTYVQRLSENSDQYVGSYSVFERLFDLSDHPFKNVFLNRVTTGADYFEYNPFVGIIKTSIFGEYNFADTNETILPFCRILLVLNMVMISLSIIALVYFALKKGGALDTTEKVFLVFYQLLILFYFIKFCFDFPHNCSMDFRYIVPTAVLGAFFIASSAQRFGEDNKKKEIAVKTVNITVTSATILFCLSSVIVYIMLGA